MQEPMRKVTTSKVLHIVAGDLAVVVGLCVVAEVVLRLVAPQPLQYMLRHVYEAVEGGGYRFKPGASTSCNNGFGEHAFSVNRWGARDKDYGPKRPGEWRILCVGDSFSENQALEVEQIYPNVLEADLQRAYAKKCFSVINAGMAGWGLWQYHDFLVEMLDEINPDVVVVALNVVGDAVRTIDRPRERPFDIRAGLPVHAQASWPQRLHWMVWYVNQLLEERSHAYVAFRRLTRHPFEWLGIGSSSRVSRFCTDSVSTEKVRGPTIEIIQRIKAVCGRHGAAFVLLSVPRQYEVVHAASQFRIQMERLDVSTVDFERPRRLMQAIASAVGTPLCDPTDDLAASESPTYFSGFAHWNAHGNQIVALALRRVLEHEGLLGFRTAFTASP